MKIILSYKRMNVNEEQAKVIIEWIESIVDDKSPLNKSPLRYVDKIEIINDDKDGGK